MLRFNRRLVIIVASFIILYLPSYMMLERWLGRRDGSFRHSFSLDDVLWIVKTGRSNRDKLQAVLSSLPYRHVVVVSDEEWSCAGHKVHNLFARLAPSVMRRIEGTGAWRREGGWDRDAFKSIPALKLAFELHPRHKLYLLVDDDTFIVQRNLFASLDSMRCDPFQCARYVGRSILFGGDCWAHDSNRSTDTGWRADRDGNPIEAAHGGSGVLLTNAALARVFAALDGCLLRYADCWAGDVQLGLCLREVGVLLSPSVSSEYVFWGGSHLHPDADDVLPELSCKRVIAYHKLTAGDLVALAAAERHLGAAAFDYGAFVRSFRRRSLSANASRLLGEHDFVLDGFDYAGGDFETSDAGGAEECQRRCRVNRWCLASAFSREKRLCYLKNRLTMPRIERPDVITSVFLSHLTC